MNVIWKIFDPMFVPMATFVAEIPFISDILENMWVNISGKEVPIERIVNPINNFDKFNFLAMIIAWSIVIFAPINIPNNESIKYIISIILVISIL